MRSFVRGALEETGTGLGEVEVVEAETGFDALRLLPRGPYDLVITDINMPHINGLELVRFIRQSEQHRTTPVLLISTQASERDQERGMTLGASAYLTKPFTVTALLEVVKAELARAASSAGEVGGAETSRDGS